MRKRNRLYLCLTVFFALLTVSASVAIASPNVEEKNSWKGFFEPFGVTGSILVYDMNRDLYLACYAERTQRRFLPASTFKILHSLIALETGAIESDLQVLPWDGKDRGWDMWNRDMDMRTAIRYSAIWFYQEMARRIGPDRMARFVNLAEYGNGDISGGQDKFWLEGGLRISSREQIEFLRKLEAGSLPFSRSHMDRVKSMIVQDRGPDHILRAKTGSAVRGNPKIGWYVGWLETRDNIYFFATNVESGECTRPFSQSRKAVTLAALRDLGVLPDSALKH